MFWTATKLAWRRGQDPQWVADAWCTNEHVFLLVRYHELRDVRAPTLETFRRIMEDASIEDLLGEEWNLWPYDVGLVVPAELVPTLYFQMQKIARNLFPIHSAVSLGQHIP